MKKATPKLYPFSYIKHEHDVQFRRYRAYNEMTPMERGEVPFDKDTYDKIAKLHEDLLDLLAAMRGSTPDGRVCYLTGPQIGLAKECVAWAAEQRSR